MGGWLIRRLLLLTNDDGIAAPGLQALERAVSGFGDACVVAPAGPRSSLGHGVTTDRPFGWAASGASRIAVDGTPADCVRLGLFHFATKADWVVAGINAGANLGADLHHSGTAAAAREAAAHGRPAIALSHYIRSGCAIDWESAASRVACVLRVLFDRTPPPGSFWNVNLPNPGPRDQEPRLIECPLDPSPLPLHFRIEGDRALYGGDYHARARRAGTDVWVCFGGDIAISLVRVYDPGDDSRTVARLRAYKSRQSRGRSSRGSTRS